MRTINEVGTEILSGHPAPLYFFLGSEYGIKCRYIDALKEHYGQYKEYPSLSSLFKLFNSRHLIPLTPCVYVVRYDDEFISTLSEKTRKAVVPAHIIGTVIGIYENEKQATKLDKYLGEYCVHVDSVNPAFVEKYLHQEFPGVADRFVSLATTISSDYGQARNICRAMKAANQTKLFQMSDSEIAKLFGCDETTSEKKIQIGIASKNFKFLLSELDKLDDVSSIYYTILQTMVELDKLKDNKFTKSDLRKYVSAWDRQDIYYMFEQTYRMLKLSRMYTLDIYDSLIYLFSLVAFSHVPSVQYIDT